MLTCSGQTSPQRSSPPAAPGQLLEELFDSFKDALRAESLGITLRHSEKFPEEDSGRRVNGRNAGEPYVALVTDVCCRPIDVVAAPLRLAVGHVGGNVYEIRCFIERQVREWTYADCRSESPSETLALGKKMAAFCLLAVEKDLGRLILEKLGKTSAGGSSESTRTKRRGLLEAVAGPGTDTRLLRT